MSDPKEIMTLRCRGKSNEVTSAKLQIAKKCTTTCNDTGVPQRLGHLWNTKAILSS